MNTRGGANLYEHSCINYQDATANFDSGWYQWFYDVTPPEQWTSKRKQVYVTPLDTDPQRQYLSGKLNEVMLLAEKKTGQQLATLKVLVQQLGTPAKVDLQKVS